MQPKPEKKTSAFKKMSILITLDIIKKQEGIDMKRLIAKLTVNEPYISELFSREIIKNLILDEQITMNKEERVYLCK